MAVHIALTLITLLFSPLTLQADNLAIAITWHPGETTAEAPRFWVHVLDPTERGDDVELGNLCLNPPERRIWCSRLHRGDPPGVFFNWGANQPGLSLHPFQMGDSGEIHLGDGIPIVTPHLASPWPSEVRRVVFGRPGFGNLAEILSPDGSLLYWYEEVSWPRDPSHTWDPGGGMDVSVMNLASAELVNIYSAEVERRFATNIAGWSPDSRRFAFQTFIPPHPRLPAHMELVASDLRVWDRETGRISTVAETVALPPDLTPPPRGKPVWSPDSRRLLFVAQDGDPREDREAALRLWWWDVESDIGGPLRTQLSEPRVAAWLPDNQSYVAQGFINRAGHLVRGEIDRPSVQSLMPLRQGDRQIVITHLVPSSDGAQLLAVESMLHGNVATITVWLLDLENETQPTVLWQHEGEALMDMAWTSLD